MKINLAICSLIPVVSAGLECKFYWGDDKRFTLRAYEGPKCKNVIAHWGTGDGEKKVAYDKCHPFPEKDKSKKGKPKERTAKSFMGQGSAKTRLIVYSDTKCKKKIKSSTGKKLKVRGVMTDKYRKEKKKLPVAKAFKVQHVAPYPRLVSCAPKSFSSWKTDKITQKDNAFSRRVCGDVYKKCRLDRSKCKNAVVQNYTPLSLPKGPAEVCIILTPRMMKWFNQSCNKRSKRARRCWRFVRSGKGGKKLSSTGCYKYFPKETKWELDVSGSQREPPTENV